MAATLVFLEKLTLRPDEIEPADAEAVRAAGVSEDEIFERSVAIVVAEGLRRLDAGLGAIG